MSFSFEIESFDLCFEYVTSMSSSLLRAFLLWLFYLDYKIYLFANCSLN